MNIHCLTLLKGFVTKVGDMEHVEKDGKNLSFVKVVLQDQTDSIQVTLFGGSHNVELEKCYVITKLRISKYMSTRILKTTEFSTVTENTDGVIGIFRNSRKLHELHNEDFNDYNLTFFAKIVSVDMKSLSVKLCCSACKGDELTIEDDFAICNSCQHICANGCIKVSNVAFTVIDSDHMTH